jgi:hypothetical protein
MQHGTRLNYTLVLNQVRGDDFRILDNSGEKERALALGASIITMKRLHEASMIKIDASSMSFWAVTNKSEGDSSGLRLLERQGVEVWLKNASAEMAKPGVGAAFSLQTRHIIGFKLPGTHRRLLPRDG